MFNKKQELKKPERDVFVEYLKDEVTKLQNRNDRLSEELAKFKAKAPYGEDWTTVEGLLSIGNKLATEKTSLAKQQGEYEGRNKAAESQIQQLTATIKTLEGVINKLCACK